jgi:hypothetical protein
MAKIRQRWAIALESLAYKNYTPCKGNIRRTVKDIASRVSQNAFIIFYAALLNFAFTWRKRCLVMIFPGVLPFADEFIPFRQG